MAHLALIIDPDPAVRRQFLAAACTKLTEIGGLTIEQVECHDLAAAWGTFTGAPLSVYATESSWSIVLGDAIHDDGLRLKASSADLRSVSHGFLWPTCDGFYVALAYDAIGGLVVSADPTGMFPFYYASPSPGSVVAATSGELCLCHVGMSNELDMSALTGILMTNGLVADRPLLAHVTRLRAGRQWTWNRHQAGREVETYCTPIHDEYLTLTFDEAWQLLDQRLEQAVRRHQPTTPRTTLMLSGGLDSRLLIGYVAAGKLTDCAITLGRDTDQEVRAATDVARVLGMRLERENNEPTDDEFLSAARQLAAWEQLAGGFCACEIPANARLIGQLGSTFWAGYVGDMTLGGSAIAFSREPSTGCDTFERFLAGTNQWGIALGHLERLLRKDGPELVASQIELLRNRWNEGEGQPTHRALRMRLQTRIRCHIGVIVHRLSVRSWPVLPFVDRTILDVVFNLPEQHLRQRKLQYAIINARFPALTDIAQDTNSFLFEPARSTASRKHSPLVHSLSSFRRRLRSWYWQKWRHIDPRRYYRLFNPDESCWRAVRAAAEPGRDALHDWFDPRILATVWPGPQKKLNLQNPFAQGAGLRLLLGLSLWSQSRSLT